MLNKLNSLRDREDGFTLIELLIVVIIIGILAAIALPIFIDQQKVAIDASVKSDVRNTVTNITNAQAQESTTATAAVSNANTHIVVGSNDATKASPALTGLPKLGESYTVAGYNAGGKAYRGTAATPAGVNFTFNSATGNFS